MISMAILCVQHFCSFGAMLFIVNLLIKTDSTVISVPCMLEHVCYEFLKKDCRFAFFSVVCAAKGMKFCTDIPRTCVHKRLVLDFHLFAWIGFQRRKFHTVHKIQPMNIRHLPNLQIF